MLVIPATGAYGHAMANNYNGVAAPARHLLRGRRRRDAVVRRESYEDLALRDVL